jgi:hypothetical protein
MASIQCGNGRSTALEALRNPVPRRAVRPGSRRRSARSTRRWRRRKSARGQVWRCPDKGLNPNISASEKLGSTKDIIPPKEMHEARIIRDAERADPGIVRRTVCWCHRGRVRRDADATPGVHFSKAATRDTKRALSDPVRDGAWAAPLALHGLRPSRLHRLRRSFFRSARQRKRPQCGGN